MATFAVRSPEEEFAALGGMIGISASFVEEVFLGDVSTMTLLDSDATEEDVLDARSLIVCGDVGFFAYLNLMLKVVFLFDCFYFY
jgi:hypothetical protein